MKITFILPFAGITGGIKHYFSIANGLVDLGHEVNIVYPGKLFPKQNAIWRVERYFRSIKYFIEAQKGNEESSKWFKLKAKIKKVPDLSEKYIPDADVVIATANETADWVEKYSKSKGEKFYYVLDYETWARSKEDVDKTFRMPLKKIASGTWQKDFLENDFKQKVYGIASPAIDLNTFKPASEKKQYNRILMLYHPLPYKGVSDGIEAFNRAKEKFPDIKLIMFGVQKLPLDLEKLVDKFYFKLPEEKIAVPYQQSDIFIWPSHREGFGLPPLEAMACGCAVITTNSGAVADFTDKNCAIIVPVKDSEAIHQSLIKLLKDQSLQRHLGQNAIKKASNFSWDKQVKKFEKILIENL
ncbi:MAG: glycosyltransferase family 4 protein [Patescibacteria group bacterium]|jgi:hypothetical protein